MGILAQGWPFVTGGWAGAWLVGGALAAAIPVLIHLIHTARAPRVPFPTLRFLRTAAERTARRRRLEHVLLMVLRMLLFALLALALARPYLSERFGLFGGDRSGAAVILLDNSYSMGLRHEGATRFAAAKQEARAILESRWRPAVAAVLLTNPGPDPTPERALADRAALFRAIDRAQLSSGRADMAGALGKAYALLDATRAADKNLWVVTDRQALSWEGAADWDVARKHPAIPVAIIRPDEPPFSNTAITGAEVASSSRIVGMPVRMEVTVRNGGPSVEKQHVLLFADDLGQARQRRAVELSPQGTPGSTQTVVLTHVFDRAGPHQVLVALEGSDALPVDNTRRIAIEVDEHIPVLVIKPRRVEASPDDPNFYLLRALDLGGGGQDLPWPIRPEEVGAARLAESLPGPYAAIFAWDVGELREGSARALESAVRDGRTLVLFCGPSTQPEEVNRVFGSVEADAGLLPARLGERVGDAALRTTVEHVASVRARSPFLEGLVDEADVYQSILVYSYLRTEAAPEESVLARLSGGDPFLLHRRVGEGHVMLFTSTADASWTNFPLRNLYLPLMMRIAQLAATATDRQTNLVAGQAFRLDLFPEVRRQTILEVSGPLGPAGETVAEQHETAFLGDTNFLSFGKTWNLGYYTWRELADEGRAGVFCTNPDGTESDLAAIGDGELKAAVGARETHVAAGFADLVSRFEATARRELWQYFLIVCLLLAVLEPLLANWMRPVRRRPAAEARRLPRADA